MTDDSEDLTVLDHSTDRSQRPAAAQRALARADRPAPGWRRWLRRAAALVGVLAVVWGGLLYEASEAEPTEITLLVNSADFGGPDNIVGDGVCDTGASVTLGGATVPKCTLRAALEEGNALAATHQVTVTLDDRFAGGTIPFTNNGTNAFMVATSVSTSRFDLGAGYQVTGPMTIDLKNALSMSATTTSSRAAGLFVTGSNVTLKNFTDWYTGGSTFVAGPAVNGLTIDGGSSVNTANNSPKRLLIIAPGARNVTLTNYTAGGFSDSTNGNSGVITIDNPAGTVTTNTVIDNVTFANSVGGTCTTTSAVGCASHIIVSTNPSLTQNGLLDGLSLTNSTIRNLNRGATTGSHILRLDISGSDPVINNLVVSNNTMTDNLIAGADLDALLYLPSLAALTGTARIDHNTITTSVANQGMALYRYGPETTYGNTNASNLWITDNYFDGYGLGSTSTNGATVRLDQSGIATVARNRFGPATRSQTTTANEETSSNSTSAVVTMYNNLSTTTNQKINTWYPTAASAQGCSAGLTVTPPTTATPGSVLPPTPVTLDVYWTASRTAEYYLGSFSDLTAATTLTVPLPGAAISANGTVSGYLRVQTHAGTRAQPQSSQYSRVVPVTGGAAGGCQPAVVIQQAAAYGDTPSQAGSTMTRPIQFTVTPDAPLTPDLTADLFSLAGSTAPGVTITSVAPQANGATTTYLVTCQAADSGVIQLSLPAGVATLTGTSLANQASTTGTTPDTDNSVTFVNPLRPPDPAHVLTDGTPTGADAGAFSATVGLQPGAPVPIAAVTIAVAVPPELAGLTLTPAPVYTIPAGAQQSGAVVMGAPVAPAATDGELTLTVSSADPQYDGLLLPPQPVTLATVDSHLSLITRAWIDVPDGATYDDLVGGSSGATEVPSESRLAPGTPVWWTYTVTYTERGTAAAYLAEQGLGVKDLVWSNSDSAVEIVCPDPLPVLTPGQSVGCLGQGVARAPTP